MSEQDTLIGELHGKMDMVILGLDKVNGRIYETDKIVARHEAEITDNAEDIKDVKGAPRRAVIYVSIIGALFTAANAIISYFN